MRRLFFGLALGALLLSWNVPASACDGDQFSGTSAPCNSNTTPFCIGGVMSAGQCTSSADCGTGHNGPTCELASGRCVDVDTDGDGIQDEVEVFLGTDPTKKDSDGDGIDDKTEVTPQGGGSFTKVDTDNDGTIDAL